MYTLKKHKSRTYLFSGEEKIKMIPVKYHGLEVAEIITSLLSPSLILTPEERILLDDYLFGYLVKALIENIRNNDKYVFELIRGAKPVLCNLVNVFNHGVRYDLQFDNNTRVTCNSELYHLAPKTKKGLVIFKVYDP